MCENLIFLHNYHEHVNICPIALLRLDTLLQRSLVDIGIIDEWLFLLPHTLWSIPPR
jgi:hypothetical protein